MNKTISLITLIIISGLLSCNSINEKRNLKNIQESYEVFNKEQSRISRLMVEKPDTALIILDRFIEKYPKSSDFLGLRASLNFQLENYENCKEDVERIISLRPDTKMIWDEMINYLNCKLSTKDKNCDSLLTNDNVYEVGVDIATDTIYDD